MKTNPLHKITALAALLVALCYWSESAYGQQPNPARPDSLEISRLLLRREIAVEQRATKRVLLQQRAENLRIPIQKTIGDRVLTLRSITPDGEPIYSGNHNLISVQTSCADSVKTGGGLGLSLTGAGQTLGIWEAFEKGTGANVRTSHREFGGRATSVDGGGFSSHATHVAGTMIGAGVNASAEGFSSGANLRCFDLTDDLDEMDDEANAATPIRVTNHSYGAFAGWDWNGTSWDWYGASGATDDWKFGAYNDDAEDWDEVAFDNPFLTVFKSAGNDRDDGPGPNSVSTAPRDGGTDGFDCIPTEGNAKNIVTVGAVDDIPGGYSGPASVQQVNVTFSGWGPTDDGRIKPDVVANGDNLNSSVQTSDSDYGIKSGTSMAAPSASGGAGLLLEHWQNVVGGAPRSATLKGLIIHEADEAGAATGPDYSNGWGLVDIGDAAQLITIEGYDGCRQFVEGSVGDGDVFTFDIQSSGTQPLKVTLTWTDPPSSNTNNSTINPAGSNLVNNLDLRLALSGGSTFQPWVLDPANPANAATTGDNDRDNVEQVLLLHPTAGTYTVRVVAPGTVEDGPQRFTLWFSGNDAVDVDKFIAARIFTGRETIAARHDITFGPAVIVTATANVRAFAGHAIQLKPGFWAQRGGQFLAQIRPGGGCGDFSGILKADNYPGGGVIGDIEARNLPDDPKSSVAVTGPTLLTAPNPFNQSFQVQVVLPEPAPVSLCLLDARGQRLHTWQTETLMSAGAHTFDWAQGNLPPGLYYVEMRTATDRTVHKMVKMGE